RFALNPSQETFNSERLVKNLYVSYPTGPVIVYRRYRTCSPMQPLFAYYRDASFLPLTSLFDYVSRYLDLFLFSRRIFFISHTSPAGMNYFSMDGKQYRVNAKTMFD